jgi:gag-polyprotein putative aspartyl protease
MLGRRILVSARAALRPTLPVAREGRALHAAIVLIGMLLLLVGRTPAACKLGKMAEFPITMTGMQPLTTAQINGRDVEFTIDSGAFFSMLSSASASELDLKTHFAPFGFYVTGVNGNASVSVATVKVFTLAGVPLHDVDFLVGGSDTSGSDTSGSVGLLGQNVLHIGDVEYDLGQGVIRLMKAEDCRRGLLAYWVKPNEGYSERSRNPGGIRYGCRGFYPVATGRSARRHQARLARCGPRR